MRKAPLDPRAAGRQVGGIPQQSLTSYFVSFGIVLLVLTLRWRRMSRVQPLKLETLWVFPALLVAVAIALLALHPPVGWGWAFCAVALVVGGLLGWQRGRMMTITVDPATHALNQKASPAALLFLIALILARQGARQVSALGGLRFDPIAVTDVLLCLATGLFVVARLEMYLRGRRLLAAARGQGSGTA